MTISPPARPALAPQSAELFARQWHALHRAAAGVAALAGMADPPLSASILEYSETIAAVGGWRYALARQGAADLAAVMEPGLTALIAAHGRSANVQAAAAALLEEFVASRDAVLALAGET